MNASAPSIAKMESKKTAVAAHETRGERQRLELVLQTVTVLSRENQTAGVGVIQRAHCVETGHVSTNPIRSVEQHFEYGREEMVASEIHNSGCIKMLSITHALEVALATVRATHDTPVQVRHVKVFADVDAEAVVEAMQRYIERGPSSLLDLLCVRDRCKLQAIMGKVEELTALGFEVVVTIGYDKDRHRGRETRQKAMTLAKKGRKMGFKMNRARKMAGNILKARVERLVNQG